MSDSGKSIAAKSKKSINHIIVDQTGFRCLVCKTTHDITFPIKAENFVALGDKFNREHAQCYQPSSFRHVLNLWGGFGEPQS